MNTYTRIARSFAILVLLAFFISLLVPVVSVEAQAGSAAAVDTGRLNVRGGPAITFSIITSIPYNTLVTLIGKASEGTWVQVSLADGRVGWVNRIHLRSFADYGLLPVTYDMTQIPPPQTVPPPGSGSPGSGPTIHVVRAGETLATIAARYRTTWQNLVALNNLSNPNRIYTGQRLIVSGAVAAPPSSGTPGVHIVQSGETLAVIAARYGTTVAAIVSANRLANADVIFAGQRLTIPSAPLAPRYYTVQAGDTLFRIALRYGTTVAAITAANNVLNPNAISVGQTLLIP
jgi:LysM repeat protein